MEASYGSGPEFSISTFTCWKCSHWREKEHTNFWSVCRFGLMSVQLHWYIYLLLVSCIISIPSGVCGLCLPHFYPKIYVSNVESRLFFKQPTSWRPRISRDLMISVASEMSRQPLGSNGRVSEFPVQVFVFIYVYISVCVRERERIWLASCFLLLIK